MLYTSMVKKNFLKNGQIITPSFSGAHSFWPQKLTWNVFRFDQLRSEIPSKKKKLENVWGKTSKEQGQHPKIQEKGRKEILIEIKEGNFTKKKKKASTTFNILSDWNRSS